MFNEFKLISRAIKRMFGDIFQGISKGISKHCRIRLRLGTVGKFIVRACFILLAIAIGIAPFILAVFNVNYINSIHSRIVPLLGMGGIVWAAGTFVLSLTIGCEYYPEEKEKDNDCIL